MKLIFLDTETTGLDPGRHEIWDFAYILRDTGPEGRWKGIKDKEHQSFFDVSLVTADSTALRMNHYYERAPSLASGYTAFLRQFAKDSDGAHLVGMVPSFDAAFIDRLLRRRGLAPAWHYHLIDAENLVAGYLGIQPPYKSEVLSNAMKVEPPNEKARHTAMGDARWTRDLYDAVMRANRLTYDDPGPVMEMLGS